MWKWDLNHRLLPTTGPQNSSGPVQKHCWRVLDGLKRIECSESAFILSDEHVLWSFSLSTVMNVYSRSDVQSPAEQEEV